MMPAKDVGMSFVCRGVGPHGGASYFGSSSAA